MGRHEEACPRLFEIKTIVLDPLRLSSPPLWIDRRPLLTVNSPGDEERAVALLAQIAVRDRSALAAFYDRHCQLVYGLALRILIERGEAEAVVDDVFLTMWQSPTSYHAVLGSPTGWLVRLTRTRAIERARVVGLPFADRVSPAGESFASQDVLAQLSDQQRTLIEQAFFKGLTRSELAARFGLSIAAVTESLQAGMQALRDKLAQSSGPCATDPDRPPLLL